MRFSNAYKGVKKLFIAELIAILAGLLALTSAILGAAGLQNDQLLIAAGTVGIITGIAALIGLVLQLVGLWQGGRDELLIKRAFYLIIFSIALGLATTILGTLPSNDGLTITIRVLDTLQSIFSTFALVCILLGISNLANSLSDEKMERKGRRLAYIVVALYVVSIILGLYPSFLVGEMPDWVKNLVAITAIVAAVIELIVYILTVLYYAKATKMLKEE